MQILTAQLVVDLACLRTNAAGTVSGTQAGLVCYIRALCECSLDVPDLCFLRLICRRKMCNKD